MSQFDDQIAEYRRSLQNLEQQMQSEYDKAVMTLSGGALGISLTFLKDVVIKQGVQGGGYLLAAWISWGLSIACTLGSFYTSAWAMRKALEQTDAKEIYVELRGGNSDRITKVLNALSGSLFVLGVILMVVFVARNLP